MGKNLRQIEKKIMEGKKETPTVDVERVQPAEVSVPKTLTLDEIEAEMMKCLSVNETSKVFLMSQKFDMLQKFAAFKLKRLEIESLKQQEVVKETEPLQIEIVRADTPEQENRIKKIDEEILAGKGKSQDA